MLKEIKDYWFSTKTNQAVFFLTCFLVVLGPTLFFLIIPVSVPLAVRLMPVISIVPFIIILAAAPFIQNRYLKAIAGKDRWGIAEINFRRYAIISLYIIAMYVLFFLLRAPGHFPKMIFFTIAAFWALAAILFFAVAALFKRRSPKAIAAGYACLVFLLVLILLDCFVLNSPGDFFRLRSFELFMFPVILIQGVTGLRRAAKPETTQPLV